MDTTTTTAVVTALGTVAVTVVTGFFTLRTKILELRSSKRRAEKERDSLRLEMAQEREGLGGFGGLRLLFSEVEESFRELCERTRIDRVIVFCAWNGLYDPRQTTAVWQHRKNGGQMINYVHVELDEDYVQRMRAIQKEPQVFVTSEMPRKCLIRGIYEFEHVTHSLWVFLTKQEHSGGGKLLTYMSFATREAEPLTQDEVVQAQLVADRLRALTLL